MGRVSRIMKTVGSKAKALPASVLIGEPERIETDADPDLVRVAAAWPHLSSDYKRTILTLIDVAERSATGR